MEHIVNIQNGKYIDYVQPDSHVIFTSFEKLKTTNPLIQESEAKIVSNLKNMPLISSGEI